MSPFENYLTGKKMNRGQKIKIALGRVREVYKDIGGMGAIRRFIEDTKDMHPLTVVEMDSRTGEIKVFQDGEGRILPV